MLILALDTATAATSVAVVDAADGAAPATLAARTEVAANRHGELLAPMIDACLSDAGAARTDLGLVAVGTGPGPFTGLRVGLVTARTLGDALGIAVKGVCTLDVVATAGPGDCVVVTDARRRELYWARYADGRRVHGPAVDRPAAIADRLRAEAFTGPLLGPGAGLYAEVFAAFADRRPDLLPDAARLAALAVGPAATEPQPLYLRRPDAQPMAARKQVTPA